jgi:hypothetical protein
MVLHRRHGDDGLPENSINVSLTGSAGQSFCAFMTKGIHVTLEGDANDYVGKVRKTQPFHYLYRLVNTKLWHKVMWTNSCIPCIQFS